MDLDRALTQLSSLPIADRLRFVQSLWDSFPLDASLGLTAEQQAELDRRVAQYETDPSCSLTREQVNEQIRKRS